MAMTARTLITRAYWLSNVVSKGLNSLSGDQAIEGLELLNDLLNTQSMDSRTNPYYVKYTQNLTQDVEKYFIPDLIDVDCITFNLQGNVVRFPMMMQSRKQYFNTYRANNISSLPFTARFERVKGGMDLYVYFLPMQDFEITIMGKFALSEVTLDTDMSLYYDRFYLRYLRYLLMRDICNEYAIDINPESEMEFMRIEKKLTDLSPPDLSANKINFSSSGTNTNWAIVNLSNGILPSMGM